MSTNGSPAAVGRIEFKENPVFVLFRCHAPGRSRVLKPQDADVVPAGLSVREAEGRRADRARVSAAKRILECHEDRGIRLVQSRAVGWMQAHSLPSFMLQSIYAIPPKQLEAITDGLAQWDERLAAAKDVLRPVYARRVDEQRRELRAHFRQADYPPVEEYLKKYWFERQCLELDVPASLKKISEAVWKQEQERHAKSLDQAAAQMRLMLREQFAEIVRAFRRTIEPDESGETKRFSTRLVKRLQEFRRLFDLRDLTGDEELAQRMRDLEGAAGGLTLQQLQVNGNVRDWFADEMRTISVIAQDMVESTGRQVRMAADE